MPKKTTVKTTDMKRRQDTPAGSAHLELGCRPRALSSQIVRMEKQKAAATGDFCANVTTSAAQSDRHGFSQRRHLTAPGHELCLACPQRQSTTCKCRNAAAAFN